MTRVYTDCSQEYHRCAAMALGTVYWFGVHERMPVGLRSSRNVSNPVKQRSAVSSGPGKGYGEGMRFLITTATVVVHRRGEPVRVEEDYLEFLGSPVAHTTTSSTTSGTEKLTSSKPRCRY